jgi:hypothetical protein
VINSFSEAGLPASNIKEMGSSDYGLAPYLATAGVMFEVTDGKNGRVMQFKNLEDLNKVKTYYDDLGKGSALFYSHTAVSEQNLILLQMNGAVDKALFDKYQDTLLKLT